MQDSAARRMIILTSAMRTSQLITALMQIFIPSASRTGSIIFIKTG